MDNLPAVQAQLIEPPSALNASSGLCSPGLKKLLTEGEDGGGACRLIHLNKTLRAECERVLPMLVEAKAPAPRGEILQILVEHAPHYGITAKMAGEWATFFGAYLDALDGLPAYAIEDGFLRWNRGEGHANIQMAGFYPKAPQLYMLAQKGKAELYTAAYRAQKALTYAEKQAPRAIPAEVRKANGDALRELAATLQARRVPDMHRPRVSPQEMADRIRQAAPVSPPADDVGDVI